MNNLFELAGRKLSVWSLLFCVLALSSCANAPTAAVSEKSATAAAGYGRAFGKVTYFEDGKEKKWGMSWTANDRLTLFVRPAAGGPIQYLNVENDGSFFWPLKSGDYVLAGYRATHNTEYSAARLWLSFSVTKPGQAVYIGNLMVISNRSHFRFGVLDSYDESLKQEQARIESAHLEPVKGLMLPEKPPGDFREVTNICAPTWGVTCSKTYLGVEPIRPKVDPSGFPLADSLTPVFEWKPSTRQDVTYDIEIYESLEIGELGEGQKMQGQLVAYKQGMREPRFVLDKPLQPDSTYQWSVRLRDGDTVSSWSSTRYFSYYIIGFSSGSGNYFGFTTPKK